MVSMWQSKAFGVMPGCRPGFCTSLIESMSVIKFKRSCEMFTLRVLAQCRDQSYGFTTHLYGIFLAAFFALDIASLHDLQKLAGKSAVHVVAGVVSILKHVLSSTEKVAQL